MTRVRLLMREDLSSFSLFGSNGADEKTLFLSGGVREQRARRPFPSPGPPVTGRFNRA